MSNSDLHAALERLRQELATMSGLDAASRQRLQALLDGIGADGDEHETTGLERRIDAVHEAIEEFEVTHPRATAILNDILVMLSNMGI
ncbi:MAG: DUF4404 family protein [Gammaproteobacteria bacterium]|nr:DUF4404 family protein [Gammaproteobacteria bacterium]